MFLSTLHARIPDKGHYTEAPSSAWLALSWHVPLLIVVSYRGIGPKSRLSKWKAQSSQKKSSILRSEAEGAELIDSVLDVVRKEAEGHGLAFKGISFSLHV